MNKYFVLGRKRPVIATPVAISSEGMKVRKANGKTMLISWGTFQGVAAHYGS